MAGSGITSPVVLEMREQMRQPHTCRYLGDDVQRAARRSRRRTGANDRMSRSA